MYRIPIWKYGIVLLVLAASVYLLWPSFVWYRLPKETQQTTQTEEMREWEIQINNLDSKDDRAAIGTLREKISIEKNRLLRLKEKIVRLGLDLQGGVFLEMNVDNQHLTKEGQADALDQAVEVISNRINQYGVSEPIIQKQPPSRINIQLPGVTDPEEVVKLIGKTARLEFKLVLSTNDAYKVMEKIDRRVGGILSRLDVGGSEIEVLEDDYPVLKEILEQPDAQGSLPRKHEFIWSIQGKVLQGGNYGRYLYIAESEPSLTGEYLKEANREFDTSRFNEPFVSLKLDKEGAKTFRRVTGDHVGDRLAIVLDNQAYSAPVIHEKIPNGTARITGIDSSEEARNLAIVLRSGAIPVDVSIMEERIVGPSLGSDSVKQGINSIIIGFIAVVIFMILYYSLCGVVADFALLLNLVILMAALAIFKATLTLPGIAGIVLTIGMAVDANVLIFERIREELELRAGKGITIALEQGYSRAFSTILDANLTTLLTALFLFQFGTGPIKGFAITLSWGIVISMFTALFVSRIVVDTYVAMARPKVLRIGIIKLFKNIKIDWIKLMPITGIISAILFIIGLVAIIHTHGLNWGIDFQGGTLIQAKFQYPVTSGEIRDILAKENLGDTIIQSVGKPQDNEFYIRTKEAEIEAKKIKEVLQKDMPENPYELRQETKVGPIIGQELIEKAWLAILFSCIGILIYVSWRFEFRFAIGAIAALIHDVLIVLGLYAVTGREINLPVVASILTIIGYSINDTIVVFDRIRERRKGAGYLSNELINEGINQTISRTMLTSGTTLLVVLSLFLLGGEVINDFAFGLLCGVVVGTYSSIAVASAVVVLWQKFTRKVSR